MAKDNEATHKPNSGLINATIPQDQRAQVHPTEHTPVDGPVLTVKGTYSPATYPVGTGMTRTDR